MFNGQDINIAGRTTTSDHEEDTSGDITPRGFALGDCRQPSANYDKQRLNTDGVDLTTYHVVEDATLIERQQQQQQHLQHKQQHKQHPMHLEQQQQQFKQNKQQQQQQEGNTQLEQQIQQQQKQEQLQQEQPQNRQQQQQPCQQVQQFNQTEQQQREQQQQEPQQQQQQQQQLQQHPHQLKQKQEQHQHEEKKDEQQQLEEQQKQVKLQEQQDIQNRELEEKQGKPPNEQTYTQLQDEQQDENCLEEKQHEHIEREQLLEQLQGEQQYDQAQGEQLGWDEQRELEEEEKQEEWERQRQQRRQQLFDLQQQLHQLRELQQRHQRTAFVDVNAAQGEVGVDDAEDERSVPSEDTLMVTPHMTKPITNIAVHNATSPTNSVCGDNADDAQGHRLGQDSSHERLSSSEKENIGLPLLHRINEALSEAAEILSHSMSPSVFVEELDKGTSNDRPLVNVEGRSGAYAISTISKPAHDTRMGVVSDGLGATGDMAEVMNDTTTLCNVQQCAAVGECACPSTTALPHAPSSHSPPGSRSTAAAVTGGVADGLGRPDMLKLKMMNLVLKLRKEMAAMQDQMSNMQDNMHSFNTALDHVIEHVCDNLS